MSYDALMRWEWEGGTATSGKDRRRTGAQRARRGEDAQSVPADQQAPAADSSRVCLTRAFGRLASRWRRTLTASSCHEWCSCWRRSLAILVAAALATALLLEPPIVGVDRVRGPLADRLRYRSGCDTGCATPPCLSAGPGRCRRPSEPTSRRSRCDLWPTRAFRSDLRARPGRRRRSPGRACARLSPALPDRG